MARVLVRTLYPRIFSGDFTGFRLVFDDLEGWIFQEVWYDLTGINSANLKIIGAKPRHLSVASSGKTFLVSVLKENGDLQCFGKFGGAWVDDESTPQGADTLVDFPYITDSIPEFSTACFFNGQAILAGAGSELLGCGANAIIWSGVGRLRFNPEVDRTAGNRSVPWINKGYGHVWFIGPLGESLFVMGDGGYGTLTPVTSGPLSSYRFFQLGAPGMIRQGMIAGDYRGYVFVNHLFELVIVSADGKVERLGYSEFIEPLFEDTTGVNLSFDRLKQRWFISNSTRCFCLNTYGLFEVTQLITGLAEFAEFQFATEVEIAGDFDPQWAFTTSAFDFGHRGLKSLEVVETGLQTENDYNVGVSYLYNKGVWREKPLTRANAEGLTFPRVTAVDFKLKVTGEGGFKRMDYLRTRVKFPDRRGVRGVGHSGQSAESGD